MGMPSFLHSSTARCSFLVSTIQTAAGVRRHVPDATEGLGELVLLPLELEQLLLGLARAGNVVEVEQLELLESLQPLVNRLEVREHATEPALVDIRHTNAGRLL